MALVIVLYLLHLNRKVFKKLIKIIDYYIGNISRIFVVRKTLNIFEN